jgi:4-alpha-methyl-delta7-sterol-4alpha-methyl oxidase
MSAVEAGRMEAAISDVTINQQDSVLRAFKAPTFIVVLPILCSISLQGCATVASSGSSPSAFQFLLQLYREPLFFLFPVCSVLIGLGAFLVFALPYTWLAEANLPRLRRHRIQKQRNPGKTFLRPSLLRLAINACLTLGLIALIWPLLRFSGVHAGQLPSWSEIAWQMPIFLVVDDFLFYWLHRLLHTPWFYDHVHVVHHRVTAPCAIAGAYFHPVEYLSISVVATVGPLLVGAHVVTVWIWAFFRQWEAAEGHSGYEFPWSPAAWLPFYEGPSFHDHHHARFRGNYANYFGYLDRWLGTESKDYVRWSIQKYEPVN